MRLAWLTDIHLNFLDDEHRQQFLESLADQADAFAITGDIGENPGIVGYGRCLPASHGDATAGSPASAVRPYAWAGRNTDFREHSGDYRWCRVRQSRGPAGV